MWLQIYQHQELDTQTDRTTLMYALFSQKSGRNQIHTGLIVMFEEKTCFEHFGTQITSVLREISVTACTHYIIVSI